MSRDEGPATRSWTVALITIGYPLTGCLRDSDVANNSATLRSRSDQ